MPLYGSIILQLEVFPTLLCCLLVALLLMLDKHTLDGKLAFVDTFVSMHCMMTVKIGMVWNMPIVGHIFSLLHVEE